MSDKNEMTELLMLEQVLKEIRDFRAEMDRQFDELSKEIRGLSLKVDALHKDVFDMRKSHKEIPEELVN